MDPARTHLSESKRANLSIHIVVNKKLRFVVGVTERRGNGSVINLPHGKLSVTEEKARFYFLKVSQKNFKTDLKFGFLVFDIRLPDLLKGRGVWVGVVRIRKNVGRLV